MGRNCRISYGQIQGQKTIINSLGSLEKSVNLPSLRDKPALLPLNCLLLTNSTSEQGLVTINMHCFCPYEQAAITRKVRTDMSGIV